MSRTSRRLADAAVFGDREVATMRAADIDAVMDVEARVYAFPWTRGNFIDSLAAGYAARLLLRPLDRELLGYCIAMAGVGEMHLLNITVVPAYQRQGHARFLLDDLVARCRSVEAARLWLEVRESNATARAVYRHFGFADEGVRRGYYPAADGREDAVVMSLAVAAWPGAPAHGLD